MRQPEALLDALFLGERLDEPGPIQGDGRIVVTAAYMEPVPVPLGRMLTSEPILTTAVGYPTEMPDVVAAMPRLGEKMASMISHRLPFAKVLEGLDIAGTPQSAKVMIDFDVA